MRGFFVAILGSLMSWWGLCLIAALDSTMVFFLPLAVDIAVIILVSRSHRLAWLYPVLAAAGSLCGAAVTFYIGKQLGERSLDHFVSKRRLASVRRRLEEKGAVALAVLDLIPPPFPFTACILAAGALEVSQSLFFITLFLTRSVRFGAEALLAYLYGPRIITWLQSDSFEYVGIFLFAVSILGTVISVIQLVHKTRAHRSPTRRQPRAA
jgi:membrane protein YqaA with SNARE-associated domain